LFLLGVLSLGGSATVGADFCFGGGLTILMNSTIPKGTIRIGVVKAQIMISIQM
jgi:hypothetical protein